MTKVPVPPEIRLSAHAAEDASAELSSVGDLLEAALGAMPLAVMAVDSEGRVRLWNPASERMLGWTRDEVLGQPLPHIPPEMRAEATQVLRRAIQDQLSGVPLRRVRKDGSAIEARLWTSRILSKDGRLVAVLGVMADETGQRRQQAALEEKNRQVRLLQEIAIAANEADRLEPALRRALELTCAYTDWPLGHAFVVEEQTGALRPSAIWCVRGADHYEPFRRDTESRGFAPSEGLPGMVLESGRPCWILDMSAEPNFPRARTAAACGLRSAFAFPLQVRTEVVATLEFFCSETRPPDEPLLEVMLHVGAQLGRVVERVRAEREREEHARRQRALTEEAERARRGQALSVLTPREREVLTHVAQGADNLKISACLGISERTVKAHLTSILTKLGLENRTQAARFAWQAGLDPDAGPEGGAQQ